MRFVVTKTATVYEARLFGANVSGFGKSEEEALGALVIRLAEMQQGWQIDRRGVEVGA